MEKLVLVNEKDEPIGLEEKVKCHLKDGILHRAFAILLFNNKKEVLIQKRGKSKMLWPLYWETSCASHPRENETYEDSGRKRLKEELRIDTGIKVVDKFIYHASYEDVGSEYEFCAILVGNYNNKEVNFNINEVADVKWVKIDELEKDMNENSKNYAPWLGITLKRLQKLYGNKLETLF